MCINNSRNANRAGLFGWDQRAMEGKAGMSSTN